MTERFRDDVQQRFELDRKTANQIYSRMWIGCSNMGNDFKIGMLKSPDCSLPLVTKTIRPSEEDIEVVQRRAYIPQGTLVNLSEMPEGKFELFMDKVLDGNRPWADKKRPKIDSFEMKTLLGEQKYDSDLGKAIHRTKRAIKKII